LVRSVEVVVYSGVEPEKLAEIDVDFIRFPLSTEAELKNGVVDVCNNSFASQGETRLNAVNPRLTKINWVMWRGTVDVVGSEASQGTHRGPRFRVSFSFSLLSGWPS